jgi:hypothetical protein
MTAGDVARRRRSTCAALVALSAIAACELQEIVTAQPEDVLVAEVVLRTGSARQTALLQRTTAPPGEPPAPGATVTVSDEQGRVMRFEPAALQLCLQHVDAITRGVACYVDAFDARFDIEPGHTYTLRIETADGRVLTGRTTTPAPFHVVEPALAACRAGADTTLTLRWRASPGAWAYIVEARFGGLRAALAERGIAIDAEPVVLSGVSVSAADTSMAFPGGLGVFSRFDEALAPALVALQQGLPAGVNTTIVVAAADRNYVNWVRGGNFNPSGPVRVGSIQGAGAGVFGSLTQAFLRIDSRSGSPLPDC